MLTNAELRYSTSSGGGIPYPGDDYAKETLHIVKEAIVMYEKFYCDKTFDIEFSNGDSLIFSIQKQNLSHMLGLIYQLITNTNALRDFMGTNEVVSSFEFLKLITSNTKNAIDLNRQYNYSLLNFYRLKMRSEIFEQFSAFSTFNFGYIRFDKDIATSFGFNTNMKSNLFLYVDSNNAKAPYYMMALAPSNDDSIYVESLFPSEFCEQKFKGQTIAYPTSISISSNTLMQKEATSVEKLRMLKEILEISKRYGSFADTYADQQKTLSILANNEEKKGLLKRN